MRVWQIDARTWTAVVARLAHSRTSAPLGARRARVGTRTDDVKSRAFYKPPAGSVLTFGIL